MALRIKNPMVAHTTSGGGDKIRIKIKILEN
jgi:hypothetical protein